MYTAEPIRGRVVDAETREPLAGVIVVAEWQLEGGLMHSDPFEDLEVRETLTGPDGTFHIDGFGPTPIPEGRLEDHDPRLVLYKVGTEFKILSNRLAPPGHSPTRVGRIPGRSVWNGRTIELKREPPDDRKASAALMRLLLAFRGERCMWKKMPRLLAALVTTSTVAENGGPKFRASILRTLNSLPGSRGANPACGSVEQEIARYLQ
jgi:hypothetical protein